jgi:RNA polymerase sigma factor (sigma-70 family)
MATGRIPAHHWSNDPRMEQPSPGTRASLLLSLRDSGNDQAWHEFYRLYRGLIVGYARSHGCSASLAREVMQETMIALLQTLPRFVYDRTKGQFRHYLCTVVRTSIRAAVRRQSRYVQVSHPLGEDTPDPFAQIPDENAAEACADWDRHWEQNLLAQALARVQGKVNETTFRSFSRYVLDGCPAAQVCEELGLTANAVYQHRNRVTDLLRREIAQIRADLEEPAV